VPLMLRTICYAMTGALALYYRSFGTASTLLRRDNISSRPYCYTMTIVYMHILHIIYITYNVSCHDGTAFAY
jgi:hypothetical protein